MTAMMDDDPTPATTIRDRLRVCQQQHLSGIPAHELITYLADVASELGPLHVQGRPSGNVSPDTIQIVNGRAKLVMSGPEQAAHPGLMLGRPAYMPPEAWAGTIHAAGDQYALACVYVEMRLGRPAFSGSDVPGLMWAHLTEEPDLTPLFAAERHALRRALAKDPAQRYATCLQFADDLKHALL